MSFSKNMAVRLRADSSLLYIDELDEDRAMAFCRRFGSNGPEGESKPYLLDALRENVIRISRQSDAPERKVLSTILCRVGIHDWKLQMFRRQPLSSIGAKICCNCSEIKISI